MRAQLQSTNDALAHNQLFSPRAMPVFAGGNSHDEGAFTNTDGFVMSRFTIAVGGVDKAGKHAGYSVSDILLARERQYHKYLCIRPLLHFEWTPLCNDRQLVLPCMW
jgi:hypothetical protein